jgi:hypothetical protein
MYLTLRSPAPANTVIGAAQAGLRYVGDQLIKVSKKEHAYDIRSDRPRMRETQARFDGTGMDAEADRKSGSRSRTAEALLRRMLSVRVSNVLAPPWADARET